MSTAISGINSNVIVGSQDLSAMGWQADYEVNSFDSTTTADAGWDDETASTSKIAGSFDIFYNPGLKPTGASAGIKPGNVVTLNLWVVNPGGDVFTGSALILKLSLKVKTKEGFIVTCSFKGKHAWTIPS